MRSPIFPRDRVTVMGVLNATPDSFSDGGRFASPGGFDVDLVVATAREMQRAGAHLLDVGGESTRPGAAEIDVDAEIARVVPALALPKAGEPVPAEPRREAKVEPLPKFSGEKLPDPEPIPG